LIFEYLLIVTFLSLSLIILFSSLGSESLKDLLLIRSADKGELFRKKNARLELWYNFVVALIVTIFLVRFLYFIIAPAEIKTFAYIPTSLLHLLIVNFIFMLFWALIWFFLHIKKEIKLEDRTSYFKKIFFYTQFVAVTDILFTFLLYFQGYYHFFRLKTFNTGQTETLLTENYVPLMVIIMILLTGLTALFAFYILKRSIKILQQYWLVLLLLLIAAIIFTILSGINKFGWNENISARILLFSAPYAYVGWIFMFLFLFSVFCNVASIILYSLMTNFTNPVKYKNLTLTFFKMGYITAMAFSILVILPNIMLWFYA
jgi:hypothetical protein